MLNREHVFKSLGVSDDDRDYFLDSFPEMPNEKNLQEHINAVPFMTNAAAAYYMPFLLQYLEHDPIRADMLLYHIEGALNNLRDEGIVDTDDWGERHGRVARLLLEE